MNFRPISTGRHEPWDDRVVDYSALSVDAGQATAAKEDWIDFLQGILVVREIEREARLWPAARHHAD